MSKSWVTGGSGDRLSHQAWWYNPHLAIERPICHCWGEDWCEDRSLDGHVRVTAEGSGDRSSQQSAWRHNTRLATEWPTIHHPPPHSASTCHQVICPCLGIMFRQNVLASWWQRSRQWKSSVISVHTYLASVHTYPASVHTYPASWGKISAVSETQVALGVWWQTDMKGRGGGTESVELTEICNYQYMYA